MLAVSAISMPAALLTSRAAIAAPTARAGASLAAQPQAGVAITISGMTPRQAAPGSTITVTGTLKNASQQQQSHLAVRLLSSITPLTSVAQLQPSESEPYGPASTPVGPSWLTTGQLKPGAVVHWLIHVKAKAIGMTSFGVYPLAAQARSTLTDVALATAATYLPYVPAKKGPYGSTIPARTKISWVWPLIDQPLLSQPGQTACQGAQAQTLAASLARGGRLGQLVTAGANGARTAITWAIDPALLADVKTLAGCGSSQPKWAAAARAWLLKLRELSSAQPVFLTPYGDPNVAALIGAQYETDVQQAFRYGGQTGSKILKRTVSAGTATATPAAQGQTASIAWPADGIPGDAGEGSAGYTVLENLAADHIQTLLLGSGYLPREHASVLRVPTNGGYMKLLLANDSITGLLAAGGSTADSAFPTAQAFLAATALLAQQNAGQPIVVAPPQRWTPAPGLAADLLAVTGSASWLSPASLTSLTSPKNIKVLRNLPRGPVPRRMNAREARVLGRVDSEIAQLQALQARPDPADYLPVWVAESSAWHGKSKSAALMALRALEQRIRQQLRQGVRVEAEPRITLGGLKGSVPVSIDNTLGYAVAVRLDLDYNPSTGMKITVSPGGAVNQKGLVTIQAGNVVTVRLRVQAAEVGSTAVTLSLENSNGNALPDSPAQRMTIQATQVGVLGVIIFAVALGIFLIATAARAARRGRPAPATDQATDPGLAAGQAADRPAPPPEPDTVMAERTELGAAGHART